MVNFQCRLSYSVCTPSCAITCIDISAHVKHPVVHVKLLWIMETVKHAACTIGWEAWMSQLAFPWESKLYFPWEKSQGDNPGAWKKLVVFQTFISEEKSCFIGGVIIAYVCKNLFLCYCLMLALVWEAMMFLNFNVLDYHFWPQPCAHCCDGENDGRCHNWKWTCTTWRKLTRWHNGFLVTNSSLRVLSGLQSFFFFSRSAIHLKFSEPKPCHIESCALRPNLRHVISNNFFSSKRPQLIIRFPINIF